MHFWLVTIFYQKLYPINWNNSKVLGIFLLRESLMLTDVHLYITPWFSIFIFVWDDYFKRLITSSLSCSFTIFLFFYIQIYGALRMSVKIHLMLNSKMLIDATNGDLIVQTSIFEASNLVVLKVVIFYICLIYRRPFLLLTSSYS